LSYGYHSELLLNVTGSVSLGWQKV